MQVQEGIYIKFVFSADTAVEDGLNLVATFGDTEGEVVIAAADDVKIAGVIVAGAGGTSTLTDGDNITVCTEGVLEVTASGAIAYGATIAADDDGQVKEIAADGTQSAANSKLTIGRALEEATLKGDVIKALIHAK